LIAVELEGVENNWNCQMNSLISTQRRNFIEGSNEYDKKGIEAEIQLNVVSRFMKVVEMLPIVSQQSLGDASGVIGSYNWWS
jgi:hypothetical protein